MGNSLSDHKHHVNHNVRETDLIREVNYGHYYLSCFNLHKKKKKKKKLKRYPTIYSKYTNNSQRVDSILDEPPENERNKRKWKRGKVEERVHPVKYNAECAEINHRKQAVFFVTGDQ